MTHDLEQLYDKAFFLDNVADSLPMARWFAPKIKKELGITSVLDVGCASGHWLSCYEKEGVEVNGIEGAKNAIPFMLIDPAKILIHDLRNPLEDDYSVDLVMSIEVAEHIEPEYADTYVDTLTKHDADYIIMTAAPPGQGGVGHWNLQPKSYWVNKFNDKGYTRFDSFEDKIIEWAKEARETKTTNPDYLWMTTEGDSTGQPAGQVRDRIAYWGSHEDAMEGDLSKIKWGKGEGQVMLPFWWPKNLIVFKK